MTDSITPPPELVQQWKHEWNTLGARHPDATDTASYVAIRAAQWGADTELEACCEWLDYNCPSVGAHHLRADRRPKPPSLKKQALNGLEKVESFTLGQLSRVSVFDEYKTHVDNIRRALEALPND